MADAGTGLCPNGPDGPLGLRSILAARIGNCLSIATASGVVIGETSEWLRSVPP